MPEIPYSGLTGNDASDAHLWKHGLLYGDADEVWEGRAKYFDQESKYFTDDNGNLRLRPDRLVMIGLDAGRRLLTVILDPPDEGGFSHVVTGWPSTRAEKNSVRSTGRKDAASMNEHGDEWHTMDPPIEDAVEIPYDPSKRGPGALKIEVEFDRAEINRLKAGIPRGPVGVTRFIKNAALAEADRLAAAAEREEVPQAD